MLSDRFSRSWPSGCVGHKEPNANEPVVDSDDGGIAGTSLEPQIDRILPLLAPTYDLLDLPERELINYCLGTITHVVLRHNQDDFVNQLAAFEFLYGMCQNRFISQV